jgi:hypothetical protein
VVTSPVVTSPVVTSPVVTSPVVTSPVGASPVGASPVGASPVGASPVLPPYIPTVTLDAMMVAISRVPFTVRDWPFFNADNFSFIPLWVMWVMALTLTV